MKKNNISTIIIVWIVVLAVIFLPEMAYAFEDAELGWLTNDYARITDMDYKAVVVDEPGSEGKIVVTERITFDVHAASRYNGFWELWRDLCEDWIDGVKVHYKVNSVKQIMPDGTEIVWPESPQLYWEDSDYESWNRILGPGKWYHSEGPYSEYNRQYECVFFYVDNLYREKVTFEIEYEMYNAVLRYGDCSDLYIAMYSGDTSKYLESFSADILIPIKDMPSAGNYKTRTYGTNSNNFPVEESATKYPGYYTFSFDLTEDDLKFRPHNEFIEFDLVSFGDDKHIFAENASINDYYNDDALDEIWEEQADYEAELAKFKLMKIMVLVVCLLSTIIVIFVQKKKISDLKRKYPFYTSDQTLDTYRDIPSNLDPKFAAELVFCKDKKRKEDDASVYSAVLLSLARKGYVEIKEKSYSDVFIYLNEDDSIGLTESTETNTSSSFNTYAAPELRKSHESTTYYEDEYQKSDEPLKSFYSKEPIKPSDLYGSFDGYRLGEDRELAEKSKSAESNESLEAFSFFEPHEPLTLCETYYLNLIKRHAKNGYISMDELQSRISTDYGYMRSFVDDMERSIVNVGVGQGYLQKANWLEPKKKLSSSATSSFIWGFVILLANLISFNTRLDLAFGGFFILGVACIAMGIYLKLHAHKYVLLTKYGEEEYKKWRGLYNFLKSDTLINERTVVELPIWEKYLVYATAFGISEKVIAAIKIRCPAAETEMGTKSIVHSSYCRSGRFRSSGRTFSSSVRSGYSGLSSGGSYGGGGFGYGGGGRGGGGGGGGH